MEVAEADVSFKEETFAGVFTVVVVDVEVVVVEAEVDKLPPQTLQGRSPLDIASLNVVAVKVPFP